MLIKAKNVIGLNVLSKDDGRILEKVEDIVYDPGENRVLALLVDKGGWFGDAKVVKYEDVQSIGKDNVMVNNADAIKRATDISVKVADIAQAKDKIERTKVVTESGTELGKVSDIIFDTATGKVEQLEISQGMKDIASGKKTISIIDMIKVGKDVTIVRDRALKIVEHQSKKQGISGTIYETKQKTEEKVKSGEVETKYKELENTVQNIGEGIKSKAQNLLDKNLENRKTETLGKYLMVNILTADDEMIARRGEMVTKEVIEKAEKAGLLEKLLKNTSSVPIEK